MSRYHLAQINIARFTRPVEDPANLDFINNLDRVNAIAESQPGFIWRLIGDGNSAMDIDAFDDPQVAINMSVWTDIEALSAFVYRTMGHRQIMRRRAEWFEPKRISFALWWIQADTLPTISDAKNRLAHLQNNGPTPKAFNFKQSFPQPG